MAKAKKKLPEEKYHFPLGKTNYTILIIGIVTLIIGYICMAIPDHPDDFLTRTLSPIILVIGYLIIIPVGLLYRDKKLKKDNK